MRGWAVVNNVWPGRQQQIKCLYLDRGILVFEHTLTHIIHVPTMSHTLLPVTQNDWCVLRHSQAFDREGKRRGSGRGAGSICDICPLTSEEQEKNTHAESEIYAFCLFLLPKTVVRRVACVKKCVNVVWELLCWVHAHLTGKTTPTKQLTLKRRTTFPPFLTKNILSHTHTHLNPQLRGSSAPFTYTLCHLDTLYCTH